MLQKLKWRAISRTTPSFYRDRSMDIEHINLIGTTLADLTARTRELRGYL